MADVAGEQTIEDEGFIITAKKKRNKPQSKDINAELFWSQLDDIRKITKLREENPKWGPHKISEYVPNISERMIKKFLQLYIFDANSERVYRKSTDLETGHRRCLSKEELIDVIRSNHLIDHRKSDTIYESIRHNVFPVGRENVRILFKSEIKCSECSNAIDLPKTTRSRKPIPATYPNSRWQIDLKKMPQYKGYNYVCNIVDCFSRYAFGGPTKGKTSTEIADIVLKFIYIFGPPRILQSDNGREFQNKDLQAVVEEFKTRQWFSFTSLFRCGAAVPEVVSKTFERRLNRVTSHHQCKLNMASAGKYKTWTVLKLKKELTLRGAVVHGRKTDLVERLIAYDRNFDFKGPHVYLPEPNAVNWPTIGYKQLIPDHKILFSKITREQIDGYFLYRLAGDKQITGDLKALEKGKDLYDGKRILACSVQVSDTDMFLSGIVGAAMKNKVTYNYRIKLNKTSGTPLNSECECPAGKGPHATCKHVASVFLMLEAFSASGELSVQRTCTENLQTFYRPKSCYDGAPVPAETIPVKRKQDEVLGDPRPHKYRNQKGFNDHVRNATINFCSKTSKDLALRYIYSKADLQTAQRDHDYLMLPFAEEWVDEALKITDLEAKQLEECTRGQAQNKKWFQEREWRITASKFGEITKITNRRNISKLCDSILNNQNIHTSAIFHGKMYEQKALAQFEQMYDLKISKCGLFVRPELPYLGASPDGVVDENCIIEVKCPYSGRNEKIFPGKLFKFLENVNGNIVLKKSSNYYDQIQGQLYFSCRSYCYFVVYTFVDIFVQKIEIDREYCEMCLLPKLELFYTKYFRPFVAQTL